MVRIPKNGSTPRQTAYARRVWAGAGADRKHIALDVGYSPAVANAIIQKIESKPGFNNAMAKLASESNGMALAVLHEFKSRGLKDFSNKDLVGALNAIGGAWSKFNNQFTRNMTGPGTKLGENRLRSIILQRVENQTVNNNVPLNPLNPNPITQEATPENIEEAMEQMNMEEGEEVDLDY